jgi:hypothetical protein
MEPYERTIAIPIMLAAIAPTVITPYLNNSDISYRKAITSDRVFKNAIEVPKAIATFPNSVNRSSITAWVEPDRLEAFFAPSYCAGLQDLKN